MFDQHDMITDWKTTKMEHLPFHFTYFPSSGNFNVFITYIVFHSCLLEFYIAVAVFNVEMICRHFDGVCRNKVTTQCVKKSDDKLTENIGSCSILRATFA